MQPNDITLSVDVANDGTEVYQVYSRFEENVNNSTYVGTGHTLATRDKFTLYRTNPTQQGNFLGVAKSTIKFTEDILVAGVDAATSLKSPIIATVGFSIPVGASIAQITEVRQRILALLDSDTIMNPLNLQLMI